MDDLINDHFIVYSTLDEEFPVVQIKQQEAAMPKLFLIRYLWAFKFYLIQ